MKTAMQLIRKNETPVLKCDCGEIFCIDARDGIPEKNRKEIKFRKLHLKCNPNSKAKYYSKIH